ncbi:hypothetical protein [Paenibacillus sp. JJ-100]|uniref:hypothetical protein n=1 Tax=Paenibacillus sp. JJ-100 TaxID=2974896 RepID=UPI00232C91FA|nr:hypothetical protein [Paenibacillus sp. JJ-100]
MMKKILSFASAFLLIFSILFASGISAEAVQQQDLPTEEIKPGNTTFTPQDEIINPNKQSQFASNGEIGTFGTGLGIIECETNAVGGAVCNWGISVVGDKINYSNVAVKFEKWNSKIFKWESISTQNFKYGVTPPKNFIQDQAAIGMVTPGFYRATLGGTFTCVEKGVYGASADHAATFTIE